MPCCGGKRAAVRVAYQAPVAREDASTPVPSVLFEYRGAGAIAVTGPFTGKVYRFAGNGARSVVHGSDAPSLMTVPYLRAVR